MDRKKNGLSGLITGIHITVILSLCCFGIIYLTLGILTLPAITSAFTAGRELLFGRYDVYDGVAKSFFVTLKNEMGMMRYFPIQIIIMLELAGMYAAKRTGMDILFYPLLSVAALMMAFLVYLMVCRVVCHEYPRITGTVIAMMYRLQYFLIIWVAMIAAIVLFGTVFIGISLLIGALLLFALEATAYIGVLAFRRLSGQLTDEEKERFGEDILNKI